MNRLTRFIVYGFAGWCAEIMWNGLHALLQGDLILRSGTSIWMFPIYGLMIFLEPIHNRIRNNSVIIRGGMYAILIFIAEFITGIVLKGILGVCPWDYTGSMFSICGIIRLDFAPVWFTLGLLFEKLHDILMQISLQKGTA